MSMTVLVPDDTGLRFLAAVDGVRAVRYDPGAGPPACAEAEVLVAYSMPLADLLLVIGRLPRLRLVQALTSGVEQWAGRLPDGIALANARGAHGAACAEWVVATLLGLYRGLPGFARAQAAGRWAPAATDSLCGKRVLVVGAGDLATRARDLLTPFGAAVTLVGRTPRPGVRPLSELPGLAGEHDVTVLMAPLTAQTWHLADAEFLSRMPDGGVLVNAARGGLIDTGALVSEVRRGRIRAILDVTDPEPLPPGHPLWTLPGVTITPHVASATRDEDERAWTVAVRQITRFVRGQTPENLV
jgi:phosphoglycerate dehydrogenase-like enzyme